MFNKFYELIGTGFANLRNGVPAPDEQDNDTHGLQQGGPKKRKRPIDCLEDGDQDDQALAVKKFRMGVLIDTVKTAAEGVKSHSSNVASWVRNSVTPTLRNILATSPEPRPEEHSHEEPAKESGLDPSTSAPRPSTVWEETEVLEVRYTDPLGGTFVSPSSTLEWKDSKSESFRIEKTMIGSKVCRRQVCMALTHRDAPKTNGHSVSLPHSSSSAPKPCPSTRLGRSHRRTPTSTSQFTSAGCSSFTSMYEKTFPIRVVQSPSHGSPSNRLLRARARCTAQESVCEEEKVVYSQLLAMVSGGQSLSFYNGSSHGFPRSHRDFTSFLSTSRRLLQRSSPAGSGAGDASEFPGEPPSPGPESSQGYSNVPSPGEGSSSGAGNHTWAPDADLSPTGPETLQSAPSPATLQDTSSQDTQSSAHDGDSVIIVKEQKGKKPCSSSVPCFQAELWIKELTSMYDSRARERRRQIEEQEALAAQLLRQRLSDDSQLGNRSVELHVRVPLEKEVPLAPLIEEPIPTEEFPELTRNMEGEVGRALKGGSQDEVLSEGFRLTITRKDLQTLSDLEWLNDEVINFYMNLLVERGKDPGLPTVHTFNTFFFPKLRSAGYSAVRRWTKKMDIFSVDIILVPVHLGVHWCLSVVDLRKKSVTYFDSMGGNYDEACRILLQYLQQESKDKQGKDLDTSEWTLQSKKRHEIPQQMNGSDCGMFTCKYAEYITKDKPITFTQKHMPYFRRRMVWEILNRKLL